MGWCSNKLKFFFVGLTTLASILGFLIYFHFQGKIGHQDTSPIVASGPLIVALGSASSKLPPNRRKLGVLYWSMNIPGQVAMREGLEREARRIQARDAAWNIELETRVAGDGEQGIERQIQQMREMVEARVDVIIVQPTDNAALAEPLREANAAGVPVIAYDQYISGGALAAYITSDNKQAGYLNGEYLASKFPNSKKLKLVLVEYPHVSSTVERLNGFLDALRDYEQPFEILKTYVAVNPKEGKEAARELLEDFPVKGSIDVVFAVNDGGGYAVAKALMNAGRNEVFFGSIDGDPSVVRAVEEESIVRIDTAQLCASLGATAMKAAYDLLRRKPVSPHILLPVYPVTRETVSNWKGWSAPAPGAFDKPWPSKNRRWSPEVRLIDEPALP